MGPSNRSLFDHPEFTMFHQNFYEISATRGHYYKVFYGFLLKGKVDVKNRNLKHRTAKIVGGAFIRK